MRSFFKRVFFFFIVIIGWAAIFCREPFEKKGFFKGFVSMPLETHLFVLANFFVLSSSKSEQEKLLYIFSFFVVALVVLLWPQLKDSVFTWMGR